jgi:hypothetical protein
MNARTRKLALATAVAVTMFVAGGSTALASGCHYGGNYGYFGGYCYTSCYTYAYDCHVQPCYYQGYCLPPLGFQSCPIYGLGLRVTYVQCHSIAYCMGLRCGDVILAVNGCPISCLNDWYAAYYNVLCSGGYLELTVRQHCGTICTLCYQFPCTAPVA